MENIDIINKQKILNKKILHQKFITNNSAPWLIINESDLTSTYHEWISTEDVNVDILIFYSFVFKRKWLINYNIYEYSINKEFFITNLSLKEWLILNQNWKAINKWENLTNKVFLNNLPYHIGWKKNNIQDSFIYFQQKQDSIEVEEKNINQVCSYVYNIQQVIDINKDVNFNFIFLGSPLRNYLFLGLNKDKETNNYYLQYQYDPVFQNKRGTKYFFTYNIISNPLFVGKGKLIKAETNKISHIPFDSIWDIDFDLYTEDKKPLYIPIYAKGFPLACEFLTPYSNQIETSDITTTEESEYCYAIDDVYFGQYELQNGDVFSDTNVFINNNDNKENNSDISIRVY